MNDKVTQLTKLLALLSSLAVGGYVAVQGDMASGAGIVLAALSSASAVSKS